VELLSAIYREALDTDPILRARGVLKGPSDLARELVLRLREEDVAVLILDDADALTPAMLEHVTGLMAVATDGHPDRLQAATETAADGTVLPQGVGVLIAGTARVEQTLSEGGELGNAWKKTVHVAALDAGSVPFVMTQLLPTWHVAATAMGDAAWAKFVKEKVSYGRAMPIGALDALARLFVRRSVLIAREEGRMMRDIHDVPWDEALMKQVRRELLVPSGTYVPGLGATKEAA
jgi:hypothetical protein